MFSKVIILLSLVCLVGYVSSSEQLKTNKLFKREYGSPPSPVLHNLPLETMHAETAMPELYNIPELFAEHYQAEEKENSTTSVDFSGLPGFLNTPVDDQDLYCFSCTENFEQCRYPFMNVNALKGNYLKCRGQCMKFKNPYDNQLWYRGCSNERFRGIQQPVVIKNGIAYFFCNQHGCNIF